MIIYAVLSSMPYDLTSSTSIHYHFASVHQLHLSKLIHPLATLLDHFYEIRYCPHISQPQPNPAVNFTVEIRCRMWWKRGQWESQEETKCHSKTLEVPLTENCIWEMIWPCLMYPPFLTSMVISKVTLTFKKEHQDHNHH